jgi:hypothetical protein
MMGSKMAVSCELSLVVRWVEGTRHKEEPAAPAPEQATEKPSTLLQLSCGFVPPVLGFELGASHLLDKCHTS